MVHPSFHPIFVLPLPAATIRTLLLSGRARESPDKSQAALHPQQRISRSNSPRRVSTLADQGPGACTFHLPELVLSSVLHPSIKEEEHVGRSSLA